MIRLYQETERQFNHNGFGALSDATSCIVTEERNGSFELELVYPITGIHYNEIKNNRIIMAKPNPIDQEQPFRIYQISKPMNGLITVNAAHISYDLSGIILSPFSASSVTEALAGIDDNSSTENPFTFWTDKSTVANFAVTVPSSIRSIMGGNTGSLLDVYGGEYAYDKFVVRLYNQRGTNSGVTIRYGKNLTDINQEENIQNSYTGVYPYWTNNDGNIIQLPEKVIYANGTYATTKIMVLDLSQEFEEAPTEESLREKAEQYIDNNKIGVPRVSIDVSFLPLEQTEEYKNIALLERVSLCDTVNVQFEQLGVDATAKVIETVYDVLKKRYTSVALGDAKTNIADTIAQQQKTIEETPSIIRTAVDNATSLITGNKGGYILLRDTNGDKKPDEFLIMDAPNVEQAVKIWRWNLGGLGYSNNGYNGPYSLAITQDGAIVADFITTGILTANIIKAGILESLNGASKINMETGDCDMSGIFTATNDFLGGCTFSLNGSGIEIRQKHNAADTVLGGMSVFVYEGQELGFILNRGQNFQVYRPSDGTIMGGLWLNGDICELGCDKIVDDGDASIGGNLNVTGEVHSGNGLWAHGQFSAESDMWIHGKHAVWTTITTSSGSTIPVLTYN